jgi:hypothetical protein
MAIFRSFYEAVANSGEKIKKNQNGSMVFHFEHREMKDEMECLQNLTLLDVFLQNL